MKRFPAYLIVILGLSIVPAGLFSASKASDAYYQAYDAMNAGKYAEAADLFTQAISQKPGFTDAYYGRGFCYEQMGKFADAMNDYKKTIELDPNHAKAYNNLGVVYFKLYNDKENAEKNFKKSMELSKTNSLVYFNLGSIYYNQKRYDEAIRFFNEAIKLRPAYVEALNTRGLCYFWQKDYTKAIMDFSAVLVSEPNNPAALVGRAISWVSVNKYTDAKNDVDKALALDPGNRYALNCMGAIYLESDRFDTALGYFNSALSQDPNFDDALFNRALVYFNTGKYDDALSDMDSLSPLMKQSAIYYQLRSRIYFEKSDYGKAADDAKKALELDGALTTPNYIQGLSAYFRNDYSGAAGYFTKYIEKIKDEKSSLNALYLRGLCYLKDKNYSGAVNDFGKAVDLNPKLIAGYLGLSDAYNMQGSANAAIGKLTLGLNANPGSGLLYYTRGNIYIDTGDYEKAGADFQKAFQLGIPGADKKSMEIQSYVEYLKTVTNTPGIQK
ncbi:MAG: tetratricopeptide repeat protein [Brevinematales bacterium]|nr:tetratricopeptide repeat protein [Brevinematales bacterium]